MEIGEPIGVIVAQRSDKEEKCWACEEEPKEKVKNDLNESPSSIGSPENDLHNDSSALGTNLGNRPTWNIRVPDTEDGVEIQRAVEVTPGAHHLIPGNAALKRQPDILKFIEESRGQIESDIGYDVNCRENGIWLPANYGVKEDSPFAKKWSKYTHQPRYAVAAMRAAHAQFHDAHPVYSNNVQRALRSLASKMVLKKPQKCGVCEKEVSNKARPPYGLVGRLHGISRMHRLFLAGPVHKWPIASGYFTSRFSALMLAPGGAI